MAILKKIISFFILISLLSSNFLVGIQNINANTVENQTLTAPEPSFVENQVQPTTNFRMNRLLLGYNVDLSEKTYVQQNMYIDGNTLGGVSFRISRLQELKASEEAENLLLELIQEDENGEEQILTSTIQQGASSMTPTEIKWLFPSDLSIIPNKKLSLRISVDNPKEDVDENNFPYYIYGKENYDEKPMYFGNMVFFDGESKNTTSDILNLSILRSDTKNLNVPIPSDYLYPELDSESDFLLNASNIKMLESGALSKTNGMCSSNSYSDGMKYRNMTGNEFEYFLRHSSYFSDKINTLSDFSSATFVTKGQYYLFDGIDKEELKEKRMYSSISTGDTTVGNKFTICVYDENENKEGDTKKTNLSGNDEIALSGLGYDTSFFLTNKTNPNKVYNLNPKLTGYNTNTKTINGDPLDTEINVKSGDVLKVYGKVLVNDNYGFNDANGFIDADGKKQGVLMYKIDNGEWKEGSNIIEIKESGELFLSIVDNNNNLDTNNGEFKILINKPIVTNSVRNNNNLYFNLNKNIESYKINLYEKGESSDSLIYESDYIDSNNVKINNFKHVYEKKYNDLENTNAIGFDGSYYYTIKGNKLLQIGSGFNETIEGNITEYTLDIDVSDILSIAVIKGEIFLGYSKSGLSNEIGKIVFGESGTATVKSIKVGGEGLLDVDVGNIKDRKIEKNRYLITTDGEYLYNISYLSGNSTNGNADDKDQGYQVRIFDPNNSMAMIKDIIIPPILDEDGNVLNKIGYYIEGAFVDRNYLYLVQNNQDGDNAQIITIDKNNFSFQGKNEIIQKNTNCSAQSNETDILSCAKNGVYDILNDRLIMLSGKVGKLHFYNIEKDNLIHHKIPEEIDLDEKEQEKEFYVSYDYKYQSLMTPETYVSETNGGGETINNDTKYVDKGVQLKNNKITATIGNVVKNTVDDRIYNEYNGGLVKLTNNTGNSTTNRFDNNGINFSEFELNGVSHKWRGDYGTTAKIKDLGFEIKGERDKNNIVPSVRYELNENQEFVKVTLGIRNDSSVTLQNNNFSYNMNIVGDFSYVDENGNSKTAIGENSKQYININDNNSDDGIFVAINENDDYAANQRLGISAGTLDLAKMMVKNITLNPYEERTFDFYIGSKLDEESNSDFYNKILGSEDLIEKYSNYDEFEDVNDKLLTTNVSKSDRVITSPEIGTDAGYEYESNNVDIVVPFNEEFTSDRVDGSQAPLSSNGWASENWRRNGSNQLETTIQGSSGAGKIASLELVKYIPEDTQISFKVSGNTRSGLNDIFSFYIDDDMDDSWQGTLNETKTVNISKGLHIFTWKYGKDQQFDDGNDKIKLDYVRIGKTLDVFGSSCEYSGSDLFYTNFYKNNFRNVSTNDGQSKTYTSNACMDDAYTGRAESLGGLGRDSSCYEQDVAHGTLPGVSIDTSFNNSVNSGYGWRGGRSYGFYIGKYGNGQVAIANMYGAPSTSTNSALHHATLDFGIQHPNGEGEMKIYFDGLFGPRTSDNRMRVYYNNTCIGSNVGSGTSRATGCSSVPGKFLSGSWQTKILTENFTNNERDTLAFRYGENDGGNDGATYLANFLMKIKDPKSGCNMDPMPYNDKIGTHFVIPGYNMQTNLTDRTKDINGTLRIIPIESDTFVEIQAINKETGENVGEPELLFNENVGDYISYPVKEENNYEITANKNVSVLMNNFYDDIERTGDTTNDDTPTYDIQNGNQFIILMPGNELKKGNLYISHYETDEDTNVQIQDLTNNKTNYDITLSGLNDEDLTTINESTLRNEIGTPYKSLKDIGEGQVLQITSDNPITIYYGLGDKPAINELLSPNSQVFYYPVLADKSNYSDYNNQMYTYYDLNLAKIVNYRNNVLVTGNIDIGDNVTATIPEQNNIGTWNRGIATGPVGLAVGNKTSSFNYIYPIKSSKKIYGIGSQYLFNNVNSDELIITADTNNGNDVDFTIKTNNTVLHTETLKPKETFIYEIDNNTPYSIETSNNNHNVFVYAKKGDNVRNTFSTAFKSRDDLQLSNKIIKNNIGDKYLKYDIVGDFDFIIDEPKKTGSININDGMWDSDNGDAKTGDVSNIELLDNEKLVVNGIWSDNDETPTNLIIDNIRNGYYINGQSYKTQYANNLSNGLFYRTDSEPTDINYLGGGLINKYGDDNYNIAVKDNDLSNNGPDGIYKIYSEDTYFPDIPWAPIYDYINPNGNTFNVELNNLSYFAKRNVSNIPFDLNFNNGEISVETTSDSNEFTDTYFVPIIREIDNNTLDFVELNKNTKLNFTKTGNDKGVMCLTVEDNNKTVKNICYTNSLTEGELRSDLSSLGRIKHTTEGETQHLRNIYEDYVSIFPDGTKPMKVTGIEFTGIKSGNYNTNYNDISIKDFTDIEPELMFTPNVNIFSEETPLSHSLKIGTLDITRGTDLIKPQSDNLNVTLLGSNEEDESQRKSFSYEGLDYNSIYIKDNDTLNEEMDESYIEGNRTYQLEEMKDYILFFRARGFGVKQIQLYDDTGSNVYIDSLFTPRQFTGNMIEGNSFDTGDVYTLRFKTGWGVDDNVKAKIINHGGDLQISDVKILKLDDSDFANTEMERQPDGTTQEVPLPNTGKMPTYVAKNKIGTLKGETTYKIVTYFNQQLGNDWIGNIENIDDLNNKISKLDEDVNTNNDLFKIYSYSPDRNLLNFVDGNNYSGRTIDKITTNITKSDSGNELIRIGLVGSVKLNGEYIYNNFNNNAPTSQFGCISGTGDYADYLENNIKEKNCLVDFDFQEGENKLEILSIVNNETSKEKGFYKDSSFNYPDVKEGETDKELLTYSADNGMPVSVDTLIPFNTNLSNANEVEGQKSTIGLNSNSVNVLSIQNINRDYSMKNNPTILNTYGNRNKDINNINRLVEFGMPKKVDIIDGVRQSDYIRPDTGLLSNLSELLFNQVDIELKSNTSTGLNSNDVLELFVYFPNKPKQFNIGLSNQSTPLDIQNIFWGDNYIFNNAVDGEKIINAGGLNDIQEDKWYKIHIPIKGTVLENNNFEDIKINSFGGDFRVSEITILEDKLQETGNNLKVTFDVDISEDTDKRDIIFGVTNNSTLLGNQGYEIRFSKNGSSTEILKNGTPIGSVNNDISFIKDDIDKYSIMFVKNKDKLYLSVKYDYLDTSDGIIKTQIDDILNVVDTNPINLKNSRLLFKNNENRYDISNIKIEDGEDLEKVSFLSFDSVNDIFTSGKIELYNEKGEKDEMDFQLYDNVEETYSSLKALDSYNGVITDVIIRPNDINGNYSSHNIKDISLIKESEIPSIISSNKTMDLIGTTKVKKGNKIRQLFTNDKEFIMGYTLFVSKENTGTQSEGLTLKMYEADNDGNPIENSSGEPIVLAQRNVNTDAVSNYPNITPLKIVFPQVAVTKGKDYIFELSTNNEKGFYISGSRQNSFEEGQAFVIKKEKSFLESFEFNELGNRVIGEKGSVGYLGNNISGNNAPDREVIAGENMQITGNKSEENTSLIADSSNINLRHQASFLFKGKFPESNNNGYPIIANKENSSGERMFGFFVDKDDNKKLRYNITGIDGTNILNGKTPFDITDSEAIIGVTVDTIGLKAKFYKDGVLEEEINLPSELKSKPIFNIHEDNDLTFMNGHNAWQDGEEMSLDYFRIYDRILTDEEIESEANPMNEFEYRLPYDLGYFMISKSSDLDSIEERTYDLGEKTIYDVSGDLILEGYDAGDGVKRVILKGSSTFRVRGNIYINADEVIVMNDNSKTGDEAISYIGFVSDNDIIIGKDVKYIQGGYYANSSIKTELSREKLVVSGLLSGNEIDLQNRTYLQQGEICSEDEKENCSVVIEFDKRIYNRMPPLFYDNNSEDGIQIIEE